MKLYLSSFGLGNKPEKLFELVNKTNPTVAIIANALDNFPDARISFLNDQIESLKKLGFNAEELDLRKYFNNQDELEAFLQSKDCIWATGGNAFLLRRAMRYCGFDTLISSLIKEDKIVYGGFSAGIVVLPPNLRGFELVDDPHSLTEGYNADIIWEGLNLIDFSPAVHYKSGHSESSDMDKVVTFFESHNIPYKPLADGEVFIIKDGEIELVQ
ncbi:MAG: Type 1 glutamine amidotransferase-like domain-containing protein [Candidatus Zambryskibacteria bacterium]|nr:Type 1 glutamine amidotransferase-like domain-containing protein [Candidatus Zambryskibacteria bacterium]